MVCTIWFSAFQSGISAENHRNSWVPEWFSWQILGGICHVTCLFTIGPSFHCGSGILYCKLDAEKNMCFRWSLLSTICLWMFVVCLAHARFSRCHLCGWCITGCQDHTLEKLRDTGLTYVYQRRVYQFWAGALDETIFWGPVQPKVWSIHSVQWHGCLWHKAPLQIWVDGWTEICSIGYHVPCGLQRLAASTAAFHEGACRGWSVGPQWKWFLLSSTQRSSKCFWYGYWGQATCACC